MKLVLAIVVGALFICVTPMGAEAQNGLKEYTVADEFSFKYPSFWKLVERENRFTTIDARLEYGNNDVQMVFEGGNISERGSPPDSQLLEGFERIIEGKNNGKVFESGLDKYVINNRSAPYAIGTYTTESLLGSSSNMVVLVTGVHVTDDEFVIVRYVADEDDFDKYLPKVEQVIKSISPIGSIQQNTVSSP
jgi:hypothetical protein